MMVEYHHYGMDSGAGERRFLMNQEWRSIMEYSSEQLRALAREFCPDGITKDPVPLGNGHINDTFLFEAQGRSHVLQRINRNVFREPEKVMENFQRVTEHIRRKVAREGGDPEKETLRLNLARDGKPYTWDENGDLWRSYAFVKDTVTYERTDDPACSGKRAAASGAFMTCWTISTLRCFTKRFPISTTSPGAGRTSCGPSRKIAPAVFRRRKRKWTAS